MPKDSPGISLIEVSEQAFGRQWAWQLSMAAIFSARPWAASPGGQQSLGYSLLGGMREVRVEQVSGVLGSIPGQRHPFVVESGKKMRLVEKKNPSTFAKLRRSSLHSLVASGLVDCRGLAPLFLILIIN